MDLRGRAEQCGRLVVSVLGLERCRKSDHSVQILRVVAKHRAVEALRALVATGGQAMFAAAPSLERSTGP